RDSAARYAQEPDFSEWSDRLEIYGLDLRHTPSVEGFCRELLATRHRLDFIINNACQTVRRPPAFYQHMLAKETAALNELPVETARLVGRYEGLRGYRLLPDVAAQPSKAALLPSEEAAQKALFPEGRLDQDLQQIDLRDHNS